MVLSLNRNRFIETLSQLVAQGSRLQNAPSSRLIPEESLACDIVERRLRPLETEGFLTMQRCSAPGQESRPSLLICVPGAGRGTLGLVGAHFDVVPADRVAEQWLTDPFELAVEADGTLRGRGVTDCLGHIALLTELLLELHDRNIRPEHTLYIVMIANEEERALPGIGLEYLNEQGLLEPLKQGTVYWLDSADFGPTIGTGGIATWELLAYGVAGHSGMPHNCVNAIELAMATSQALCAWFAIQLPPHPDEARWKFECSSSCKATVVECDNNKITKIPGYARILGDLRITPFYDVAETLAQAVAFVAELNQNIQRGVAPKGFPRIMTEDGRCGRVELRPEGKLGEGIACNLDSPGLAALTRALREVRGESSVRAYSMTGSLPLVRDLQRQGFDVQVTGFGEGRFYHAPNEQGKLQDFEDGLRILGKLVRQG